MNHYYDDMTKLYQVTKTLQFGLKPLPATARYLSTHKITEGDKERHDTYIECKKILDGFYRYIIACMLDKEAVKQLEIDWGRLYKLRVSAFSKSIPAESKKTAMQEYSSESTAAKAKIIEYFKRKIGDLKRLEPTDIINTVSDSGSYQGYNFSDHDKQLLTTFKGFGGYFTKYKDNRNFIFSSMKRNSVSYRIVNDNFVIFADNITIFENLPKEVKIHIKETLEMSLHVDCERIFDPANYVEFISETGIEKYNMILGGKTLETGAKLQGINELLNEANQKGILPKRIQLSTLYKQIMSESNTFSFVDDKAFEEDEDVLNAVKEYSEIINKHLMEAVDTLCTAMLETAETEHIYVLPRKITAFSSILFGETNWWMISERIGKKKDKPISIDELEKQLNNDKPILSLLATEISKKITEMHEEYSASKDYLNGNRIGNAFQLKKYLDSIKAIYHTASILNTVEINNKSGESEEMCPDKDPVFYGILDNFCEPFVFGNLLYSRIQKYATRKEYSTEKYVLKFGNAQLGNGWDKNKERDYRCIILKKDETYYLGIYSKEYKSLMPESDDAIESAFQKMVYKQIPNASKYFSKKQINEKRGTPPHIYNLIQKNKSELSKKQLAELITYITDEFIPTYEMLQKPNGKPYFNFAFKTPEQYTSWNEFCADVDRYAYSTYWAYVGTETIETYINNGWLYLFEIYNKDSSPKAHGKQDLYTIYFNNVFSDENFRDPVFKLNGNAEFFFRPASIKDPFIHKEGTILFNKRFKNGLALTTELIDQINNKISSGITIRELQNEYPDIYFKTAKYDVIKNRRYTKDQYTIHLPITINRTAPEPKNVKISDTVLKKLAGDKTINILGIDRGERNLIYATVIDQSGKIIEQRSLNVINGFDYHDKLSTIESDRLYARQTWSGIGKIADYKKGYLSLAVNEICHMVMKYNAVVVMENLNASFKRIRSGISEKAVYREFENNLVKKLNYLVLKDGDTRTGYQLTDPFITVDALDKAAQSGIVFYIPAAYTSQIDPRTGFVNLFTRKELEYENREKTIQFLRKFNWITYNEDADCYDFNFTYSKFNLAKTDPTDTWTVSTIGKDRIVHHRTTTNQIEHEVIDVTAKLKKLFAEYNVTISSNMIDSICDVTKADFFKELLYLLKATLQIRYSDSVSDFILSPVIKNGKYFDSRSAAENEPKDGDANGAYHIALEGLRTIKQIDTEKWQITKEGVSRLTKYLEFCQSQS